MSEVDRKAADAAQLIENRIFKEALKQLQDNATSVFIAPGSSPEEIMAAHEKIRAASIVLGVLQGWITDKAFQDKAKERSGPR